MDITLLVIGRTTQPQLDALIAEYTNRVKRYTPFEIKVIPDPRNVKSLTAEQRKQAEGKLILSELQPSDFVMLLDEHGKQYRSVAFAEMISKRMASGLKRLVFCVGGPYGFAPEVYERANAKISLSEMTFPHEMVRLFFVEQLYRAMTIRRGEPYHHE